MSSLQWPRHDSQNLQEVPWKQAAGLRDITAHRYQTLRMEDVYSTLKIDFPWIKEMLKKILDEETEE